ncbi:MAG: hypothetical protein KF898_08770 [Parachlamydiales bacterium]|nr:hypothetical protein [Candidatus Acheromyda pituitae]
MATTAALPVTGQATAMTPIATTASQPQPATFMQRCVQELNPEVSAELEWDAKLSNIAAITNLVALGIFCVAEILGVSLISIVNPLISICAIPFVGIATGFVGYAAAENYSMYSENSAKSQQKAEKLRAIAQEYQSLPEDAAMTGIKLATMRIQWNTIPGVQRAEDLNQFRPYIARYEYWRKQQEHFDREANTLTTEASDLMNPAVNTTIAPESTPSQRAQGAVYYRLRSIGIQENALASKAYAAFTHALILRPEYTGDGFEGIAKVKFSHASEMEVVERLLAQQFNDPGANHFIEFQDRTIQPITFAEIRDNPIHVIAQRFVQAIAASAA